MFAVVASAFFFFFKQKTAYEIGLGIPAEPLFRSDRKSGSAGFRDYARSEERFSRFPRLCEIGRASCRERVEMWVGDVLLKRKREVRVGRVKIGIIQDRLERTQARVRRHGRLTHAQ